MGYNRINYLKTVLSIQKLVQHYKKKGVSQKWVFDNVINQPEYPVNITYATFRKYMCVNAKADLNKLTTNEKS